MTDTITRRLIYVLFALSGFAGLIYESIWSHYLKLFLGHAAYAQSLVLAIFMGGMAIGAWLVARRSEKITNLLLAYAVVEGLLACAGIFFHSGYQLWMDIAYNQVIPALSQSPDSIALVQAFKWCSAALLILPQTILLGMTFPLIAGALVRVSGDKPGQTIAILYFTNSLGASLGVLTSGFVLIQWVGLPGTTITAGIINAFLALTVLLIARKSGATPPVAQATQNPTTATPAEGAKLLLIVAALTGTASFIYEIAWVRMLSIVLGASTHAFELMLSAFIMGLALGGLWVRRHVDRVADLPRFLGHIQIVMGLCALGSLVAYNFSFEAMAWIFHNVDKTDTGYRLFNLYSQGIAFAVMLPATFCAGMTLPLITSALLKNGLGERSIGHVYAFNTLGAIVGVFATVHLLLPQLGLKGAIVTGAGVDLLLGVVLLLTRPAGRKTLDRMTASVVVICLGIAVLGPGINQGKIVSSVMRGGIADVSDKGTVKFHRDGKTASISVFEWNKGTLALYTNGKGAASVQLREGGKLSEDESTMTQLGALPPAFHPDPKRVAVIGFGVGMAAHVMLADERVEQMDIIEIEEQIVAGAAEFAPRFQRAVKDPRSSVHIEDARTFFALADRQYDIIVSAPSNLWVSGVSSLFTRQFYQLVSRNLAEDGILAQWFHIYEIDIPLAATIFNAVASEFSDYHLYVMNRGDVLLIAGNTAINKPDIERLLGPGEVGNQLYRVDVRTPADLKVRWLGDRQLLKPFFDSYPIAANDDFYPLLGLGAGRTRFLNKNARDILSFPIAALPIQEMLRPNPFSLDGGEATPSKLMPGSTQAPVLLALLRFAQSGNPADWGRFQDRKLESHRRLLNKKLSTLRDCSTKSGWRWRLELTRLASIMESFLSREEQHTIWNWLLDSGCRQQLSAQDQAWLSLVSAVSARDAHQMHQVGLQLLTEEDQDSAKELLEYALGASLLGSLALGDQSIAADIWRQYGHLVSNEQEMPTHLRLLVAQARAKAL